MKHFSWELAPSWLALCCWANTRQGQLLPSGQGMKSCSYWEQFQQCFKRCSLTLSLVSESPRTPGTGLDPPHLELGTDWLLLPAPFSPGFPSSSSVDKEFWNWNDAQPSVDQTVFVSNPVPLLKEQ